MKKMIFIVAFLCGIVCAEESCYTSTESGHPQICDMQGYVCKLGVDIGAQYNAMFFYLGTDSSCSNLFKSSKFTTIIHKFQLLTCREVLPPRQESSTG